MDAGRSIWQTDAVRAARESGDLGAVVRCIRQANHLTLAELAQRCGYSAATISRLERGKQPLSDVRVLRVFAQALRIPPHVLGLVDTPPRTVQARQLTTMVGTTLVPDEETDPMRRRTLLAGLTGLAGSALVGTSMSQLSPGDAVSALESALLGSPLTDGVPVTLPRLRDEVAATRAVFQHGHYAEVATRLPGLLSTAMATRAESSSLDVASVDGQLAGLYTLASELMIKLGQDQLAWTTADRALQAAYGSGDVLNQAVARRAWAIVLRRTGRAETAQRLVIDTAADLQADLHRGPEYLSVYGSLLSTAAYTAAVDGDRDTARTLIGEAVEAADRLGADGNHRFTAFGPTGVGLYRVSIARVLGDSGTAIEVARRINPAAIPVTERRARYWSDVARSFHQWGKHEQCYRALLAAEQAAPDEVRYRKPIQQITTSMLRSPSAQTLPGLHAFARRTGASA
ncbi:MAG TPA: helix-turn-helix transcriptional regulator [Pseudonocardiaceae bacterium]|nr:helix-turn-helix transcriptional regulator [Pseudonocardiaceae bacterium]